MRFSSALVRPRAGLFLRPGRVRPSRSAAAWLCAVAAAALATGCTRPEPPPEPVRAVKLLTVGEGDLQAQREFAGEVRARVESRLSFRVAGKLVQRHVELGQAVKPGQLLAQLDAQDYVLALDAARAQVAAAVTQRDLAAADFKRFAQLKAQNFISGAELERREATLKSAQAQLDQAQAQVAAQGNQQAYTRLVADVAGVVTGIEAEPGQVLSAGTTVVRIAQDGARDVVFSVPEDQVARVRVGQDVQVRTWSGGAPFNGKVRDVAASADPVTRTYLVKVAVAGAQVPALGSTVYALPAALSQVGQKALKLPTSALRQDGQQTAVWVYDAAAGTVRSQPIEIAAADGNEVVVRGGLAPGMQVVATGVHVLAPGQKVSVYQPKTAPTPASKAPAATDSVAPANPPQ